MIKEDFYEQIENIIMNTEESDRIWLLQRLSRSISPHSEKASLIQKQKTLAEAENWLFAYANASALPERRLSRLRTWLLFLIMRYGALRPGEALSLSFNCIDFEKGIIKVNGKQARDVPLPFSICRSIKKVLQYAPLPDAFLNCDPSQLKRSFNKCCTALHINPALLTSRSLKACRIAELRLIGLDEQHIAIFLGLNKQTSTNEDFDILRMIIQPEQTLKTSARNVFRGVIIKLEKMGILVKVVLRTEKGLNISAIITETSRQNLELKTGKLLTAMVKAPFVRLEKAEKEENCFFGKVSKINKDELAQEIMVELSCGGLLCALYSFGAKPDFNIEQGMNAFVHFNPSSVILTAI